MEKIEKMTPVDGVFTHDEAKEFLMDFFTSKINFYAIKNWISNERFGKDDESAQKRIPELRKEVEKLQLILKEAQTQNKKLVVSSELKIILSNN